MKAIVSCPLDRFLCVSLVSGSVPKRNVETVCFYFDLADLTVRF